VGFGQPQGVPFSVHRECYVTPRWDAAFDLPDLLSYFIVLMFRVVVDFVYSSGIYAREDAMLTKTEERFFESDKLFALFIGAQAIQHERRLDRVEALVKGMQAQVVSQRLQDT
jgi:hypothetical protein